MSEHTQEHIDLCAAKALGSLDPADRSWLEEHLASGCEECERALAEFSAASVMVAVSAPPAQPSALLRNRVLAAVAGTTPGRDPAAASRPTARDAGGPILELRGPGRPAWQTWMPLAAAAALAVATVLMWVRASQLAVDLDTARDQLAQLEQKTKDEQKWGAVLDAPQARVSVLEATTDGSPYLHARATYDPATQRAVVVVENLTPPAGHDYQLWIIRGGAPASLGVIKVDSAGRAVLRLENVGETSLLSAFAVSLEATGGSPNPNAPTGPVVMLGKLSG